MDVGPSSQPCVQKGGAPGYGRACQRRARPEEWRTSISPTRAMVGRYFHMDFPLCLDIQLSAAPTPPNAHTPIMMGSRPDVDSPKEEPGNVGRGYTPAHPASPAPRRGRPEDRMRGDLGVTLFRYRYPRRRCGEIGYARLHNSRDVGICRCPRSTEGRIRNTRIRTKKYEIAEADAEPPDDGRSEAAIGPFRPRRPIRS